MHYYAYGTPGDVYNFRAVPSPAVTAICPSGGTISYTLLTTAIHPTQCFGIGCTSGATFDLGVYASFRRGVHAYDGTILVDNAYCHPVPGTLTMQVSPKLSYCYSSPTSIPSSGSGTYGIYLSISWNWKYHTDYVQLGTFTLIFSLLVENNLLRKTEQHLFVVKTYLGFMVSVLILRYLS